MNQALWFRRFGNPREILQLECEPLPHRLTATRVRMLLAPINPSDLLPITGAYCHRVQPPRVPGYEGVGIVAAAPSNPEIVGRRVLPIRGAGTWQRWVDASPDWLVQVPDWIPDELAARSYINPVSALLMLKRWKPAGKRIMLTAANSSCALLLAQWSLAGAASEVAGITRHKEHHKRLELLGVRPVAATDTRSISRAAADCDLFLDAVGGPLADFICDSLPFHADVVNYGLLSGTPPALPNTQRRVQSFHLLETLTGATRRQWDGWFDEVFRLLPKTIMPELTQFPIESWDEALRFVAEPGRASKPAFRFAS